MWFLHISNKIQSQLLIMSQTLQFIYIGRESSTAANRKKHLQIKKTTSSIWQHTCCKCSQHNQKRNVLQIKCIWLCYEHLQCVCFFICLCYEHLQCVCFFICLCYEHFHHLLWNWWKCFLDLLVLFLFACVFWSCSSLSSLGHRSYLLLIGYNFFK